MSIYKEMTGFAQRIEQEIRKLGHWQETEIEDSAFDSERDFFTDTMTLYQWLQFVLVPTILEIVKNKGKFPGNSNVAAHAVREWDGVLEAKPLIDLLTAFDHYVNKIT